jgi:ADP-heptose:LPS heptosyltransferase
MADNAYFRGSKLSGLIRRIIVRTIRGPLRGPLRGRYRAAIVKLDRLGDFVLALAAIRRLLEHYGEEECLLMISPVAEPLAQREFPRTSRLLLPASQGHGRALLAATRFRRQLGGFDFETVICLRHQRWDYDELVLSWMRAGKCLRLETGFTERLRPEFRTFQFDAPGARLWRESSSDEETIVPGQLCRELMRHRELVEAATGRRPDVEEILPALSTSAKVDQAVVITPLSSEPIKDFPVALLTMALKKVRQHSLLPMVLIGSASQKLRLEQIRSALAEQKIDGVMVRADLLFEDYLNLLAAAPLVLTADTATAHLATALDRNTIVLLGGGHYGEFGPWRRSSRQVWLTERMDCFGCDWRCIHPAPYCLTRVSETALLEAVGQRFGGDMQ